MQAIHILEFGRNTYSMNFGLYSPYLFFIIYIIKDRFHCKKVEKYQIARSCALAN